MYVDRGWGWGWVMMMMMMMMGKCVGGCRRKRRERGEGVRTGLSGDLICLSDIGGYEEC